MLEWTYLGASSTGQQTVLALDGTEIARMWQRVDDGSWHATHNQHLPWNRRYDRPAGMKSFTFVSGKKKQKLRLQGVYRYRDRFHRDCCRRGEGKSQDGGIGQRDFKTLIKIMLRGRAWRRRLSYSCAPRLTMIPVRLTTARHTTDACRLIEAEPRSGPASMDC